MRLFDDSFDIFNDELDAATGATEVNYVSVDMNGSKGNFYSLEDILENDTEIDVDLDIFDNKDQADLDFDHSRLSDMAYFGSVYAIVVSAVDKLKSNYPNGFSILGETVNTGTIAFSIDNTYLYGSTHAFPNETKILDYTLYEISDSTSEIVNEYSITGSTIGLTYGILYLDGTPLGAGYNYIVGPNKALVNPFLATLNQYERTLLEPPYNKENFWPRDAIVNSILVCEGSPFSIFTTGELNEAISSDNTETNIMWRKMYPQGQKMLDNDDGLMKRLILTYAATFDTIKKYQDHLAFTHTIDYSQTEHIPDDLVTLLADQWNWSLVKDLNQSDISEYIYPSFDNYVTGQTQQQLSGKDINFERWRRILTNIIFLYKKKGTRAGMKFFANIYGIPERLFFIDEIIDRILLATDKNPHNYVVTPSKIVVHTESGMKYVSPNTGKIQNYPFPSGKNTTYLTINISPYAAIEFEYFDWAWSDHPPVTNVNNDLVDFQSFDEPEEVEWFEMVIQNLIPSDGTARYSTNYPLLENEGSIYYENAATPWSLDTLQPYIEFLDDNWATIARNLVPAASKLLSWGTLYRNQFWNRQKYQWDDRELEQKTLPFNREIELNAVVPVIEVGLKFDRDIELSSVTSTAAPKLDDTFIISQPTAEVNKKPEDDLGNVAVTEGAISELSNSNIDLAFTESVFVTSHEDTLPTLITNEAEKIDPISDSDSITLLETTGNTYTANSPQIIPSGTSEFIGSGILDLLTYSSDAIIQSIDRWVNLNLTASSLSPTGFSEFEFKLFEKGEDGITLSDEIYSILSVSFEAEQYGTYKLSSIENILPNEYITVESSYVPYLNQTVKVEFVNTLTNEITTRPSIGLFHLPLGGNGSQINWLSYIQTGLLNRLYVAHENGNASYQSLINLMKILTEADENDNQMGDAEWDAIVQSDVFFDPIEGDGDAFQIPDHARAVQNRQIIVAVLSVFDNQPIEFIYASILVLEFLKANNQYSLDDNSHVMIGNMLQTHTRATFKRVISFFDWSNPVQEIIINNDAVNVDDVRVEPNIGEWGLILPDLTTGTTVTQGVNILSGTSTIRFGGLNNLNNRILKDKCEYFYTLKASTTSPNDWPSGELSSPSIDGILDFRDIDVIESKIEHQIIDGISYYGRNFTFFNRPNEPQLVDVPTDVSVDFFAPNEMPPNPTSYHSFDGVGDSDRLELQLYPVSGVTTYGNVEWDEYTLLYLYPVDEVPALTRQGKTGTTFDASGALDVYDAGVGRQDDITVGVVGTVAVDRSKRRLSWRNWLNAHSIDTPFEEFSGATTLYTAEQIIEYDNGVFNSDGYAAHYAWMVYWDGKTDEVNDPDPLWHDWAAVSAAYNIDVPTGDIDDYRWSIAIDPREIKDYDDISEEMWRDNGIIKTIELKEYATDGYLYQSETILDAYQAYWWRILNFRNTTTLFGHNLEIFTSTVPRLLVTGPDGHGGEQSGGIPDEPDNPIIPDREGIHIQQG